MKTNLEELLKKHPFIYEVGDKLYYIGQGVFKECIDQFSCTYFERYKQCVQTIGSERIENISLNSEEVEDLIYNFKKVKIYSVPVGGEDVDPARAKKDTLQFITSLSREESVELLKQLNDFINIFKNYYYPKYPYN